MLPHSSAAGGEEPKGLIPVGQHGGKLEWVCDKILHMGDNIGHEDT